MDMGKLLGWLAIGGTVVLVGWYLMDPVGFGQNPLISILKDVSNRAANRIR